MFYFTCAFLIFCVISPSTCSVLGTSACHVWANYESACKTKEIDVKSFPSDCSSIIYDRLDVSTFSVRDSNDGSVPKGYLASLATTNKPVIVSYFRGGWAEALQNISGLQTEVESWKTFLAKHTMIKGLIIFGLEVRMNDPVPANYTANIINYLGMLKTGLPGTEIGIYINSASVLDIIGKDQITCLDFKALESHVEFFVIIWTQHLAILNCTSANKYGDVIVNDYMQTMQTYIEGINLTSTKLVIDIFGTPSDLIMTECQLTYSAMCLNPNVSYCAETQQHYYDKAKYYQQRMSGFALRCIDTDDASGDCKCERKFPVFYALLDGFTNKAAPKICALLDRPDT